MERIASTAKEWVMSQDDFDRFLRWLDPNRDEANKKYLKNQRRLIRLLRAGGCSEADADGLADETITRVVRKMPEIADSYTGDPMPYLRTVARYVFLEYLRKLEAMEAAAPLPPPDPWGEKEPRYACMDQCIKNLKPDDQRIALLYYTGEGREKIQGRRQLAEELGGSNALRIRMFRIRETLRACIDDCMKQSAP